MKFLHTADWHVGQKVAGLASSRHVEHEAVLQEIVDIAVREKADCVLVAGDMFHNRSPQAEEERIVFEFFAQLIKHKTPAVAICGNHENPRRLAAWRSILSPLGIHLCPEPVSPDQGGILRISARNQQAVIAALPYVPSRYIVDSWGLLDPEQEAFKSYADRVAQMMKALAQSFSGSTVNVFMGHMFLDKAEASGSEWSVNVRLPYTVPAARLPTTAQYVALGDLHRPQEVAGSPVPARYAGSPLQLDFGEEGQRKSVTIIEAMPGQPARVEMLPLTSGRSLRTVEGTIEELKTNSTHFGEDYLRVFVKLSHPVTGLAEQIREFLPNAAQIRPKFPESLDVKENLDSRQRLTPAEQFGEWYLRQHMVAAPEPLLDAFRNVYEEALSAAD